MGSQSAHILQIRPNTMTKNKKHGHHKKWYAVWCGRTTGVFDDWDACHASVNGFSRAGYASFASLTDAQDALRRQPLPTLPTPTNTSIEGNDDEDDVMAPAPTLATNANESVNRRATPQPPTPMKREREVIDIE